MTLNGKAINKNPAKEKWDFETDDAWIRLSEGGQLSVYNLGVLVRKYSAYQFGCGGVVVTKPGIKLALNMARNDILVAECEAWKRIRKLLQANTDQRVRTKRTRLSDEELENFARRFIAGEISYLEVANMKLITDIVGRGHTIKNFVYNLCDRPITTAEKGSQLGERAHTSKLAFVLGGETLERFDAESVEDFRTKLISALNEDQRRGCYLAQTLELKQAIEDLREAAPTLREGYDVLRDKDLSKAEQAGLRALAEIARRVSAALVNEGLLSQETAVRQIYLGVSDVAEAWTDGRSRIVVERRQLELMKQGIGGFVGLTNLLVHEYLHDSEDMGSHTHDQEFYSRYHDATCSRAGILNQAVQRGFRQWMVALHSLGQKVPASLARALEPIEKARIEASEQPQTAEA